MPEGAKDAPSGLGGLGWMTPEQRRAVCAKGQSTRRANRAKREAEAQAAKQAALERATGLQDKIQALESQLIELERALRDAEVAMVGSKIMGKRLLQCNEIALTAVPWNRATGIYFLLDGNEVIYVGQSVHVWSRIASHGANKQFDRIAFVPCEADELDKLESFYIHALQPKANGRWNNGELAAPFTLAELLGQPRPR